MKTEDMIYQIALTTICVLAAVIFITALAVLLVENVKSRWRRDEYHFNSRVDETRQEAFTANQIRLERERHDLSKKLWVYQNPATRPGSGIQTAPAAGSDS